MENTPIKLLRSSLVVGCVMAMGLFGTPAARATESQAGDATAITILMYPCTVQNGVVVCPPPLN